MSGAFTPSLQGNPRLGAWLTVVPDGRILVRSGKVELGQGILAALAQIVADELDVDLRRVTMVPATTAAGPDESYTAGSLSIQHSGGALRQVCAEARLAYLQRAASVLGTDVTSLAVEDGAIVGPSGTTSYWELADDRLLDRDATGSAAPKPPDQRRWSGTSPPRPDLEAKVAGRPSYIHDLRLAGQLHGRVVRPPAPGARLLSLDAGAVDGLPGIAAVVEDGDFVGVVAAREDIALRAADLLATAAVWGPGAGLPDEDRLVDHLVAAPATSEILAPPAEAGPLPAAAGSGPLPASAGPLPAGASSAAVRTWQARFSRPYLAHGSIGPSCAVARWRSAGGLEVWSSSQGIHNLRRALADTFDLEPSAVEVAHVAGAGCYGHNGADDVALDAALLARAVPGTAVQVVWSRQDEMAWSPLAPAMVVDIEVSVDADGLPCRWRQEIRGNGHSSRPWSPGHPPLLAALQLADAAAPVAAGDPPMATGAGSGRNAVPGYRVGPVEVISHRLQEMPLRTSAMRALGAHLNVYAIEQVIDELAAGAGRDPVAYRLALLDDPRARRVVVAAAAAAGWGTPLPAGTTGRGVGWARYKQTGAYCAVVAEVEAETAVRVTRLTVAADVGAVVNPAGATAQLEGAAVQATSWTVKEQVRFDRSAVTSLTWDDYPILTFSEVPEVDVVLVGDPSDPSLGAGEAAVGPTAAAIGNALAAALGIRVRSLPLSAANILAAIG